MSETLDMLAAETVKLSGILDDIMKELGADDPRPLRLLALYKRFIGVFAGVTLCMNIFAQEAVNPTTENSTTVN